MGVRGQFLNLPSAGWGTAGFLRGVSDHQVPSVGFVADSDGEDALGFVGGSPNTNEVRETAKSGMANGKGQMAKEIRRPKSDPLRRRDSAARGRRKAEIRNSQWQIANKRRGFRLG